VTRLAIVPPPLAITTTPTSTIHTISRIILFLYEWEPLCGKGHRLASTNHRRKSVCGGGQERMIFKTTEKRLVPHPDDDRPNPESAREQNYDVCSVMQCNGLPLAPQRQAHCPSCVLVIVWTTVGRGQGALLISPAGLAYHDKGPRHSTNYESVCLCFNPAVH
jgi:hypothetical protein